MPFVELEDHFLNTDKIIYCCRSAEGTRIVMSEGHELVFGDALEQVSLEIELAIIGDADDNKL